MNKRYFVSIEFDSVIYYDMIDIACQRHLLLIVETILTSMKLHNIRKSYFKSTAFDSLNILIQEII